MSAFTSITVIVVMVVFPWRGRCEELGNKHSLRLFEDLLSDYNKLVRPIVNKSAPIGVKFKMRLSQLLDVHEKNQIITTNVWLEHEWYDPKLSWDPMNYGNVTIFYVPSQMIWLPDIVLYNNADGNYEVTIMTKATVLHTGLVSWNPPAIYKSFCGINVEWFPFDEQECDLKFGSWTYDGFMVDLLHKTDEDVTTFVEGKREYECVENGIDLSDYYRSTEWDILAVPGWKKRETYPCCPSPYIDITYKIFLRRKTLFYTVNLILPCLGISFLTILVFYLPNDSGEKVTLSISILISLTVFFLLLVEIIPATSLVVPLIGKYLLFTMIMVTISICVSVIVINVHYRSPSTHRMSSFTRVWFLDRLPKLLFMHKPTDLYGLADTHEALEKDEREFAANQMCSRIVYSGSASNKLSDFYGPLTPDNDDEIDEGAATQTMSQMQMQFTGRPSLVAKLKKDGSCIHRVHNHNCNQKYCSPVPMACQQCDSTKCSHCTSSDKPMHLEQGAKVLANHVAAGGAGVQLRRAAGALASDGGAAMSSSLIESDTSCCREAQQNIEFIDYNVASLPSYGGAYAVQQERALRLPKRPVSWLYWITCHECAKYKRQVHAAIGNVGYIAANLKRSYKRDRVLEDWKFVALVIDRFFLILFCLSCLLGTALIILQAPTLYDTRVPIDMENADQRVLHRQNGVRYCNKPVALGAQQTADATKQVYDNVVVGN